MKIEEIKQLLLTLENLNQEVNEASRFRYIRTVKKLKRQINELECTLKGVLVEMGYIVE